jgi:D-alanyl-D-alanine carboxypeptidase/D-alanyl-D-alanine-endopeptidase (penicillin-binding protein 4)
MLPRWTTAAAAACLWCVLPCAAQPLNDDVDRLIEGVKLGKDVRIGVSIIDARSGQVLAERRASEAFTPASNMKLLTTGAALLTLGPDHQFRTEVVLDGDRVILRGTGDPALADPELLNQLRPRRTVGDVLEAMAAGVKRAGVSVVSEVVVDDRVFDREFTHPSWLPDHLNQTYGAQVAGVNFHANVLTLFITPSRDGAGAPPGIRRQPDAFWIDVDTSKARTVREGGNQAFVVRLGGANRFQLSGQVRSDQSVSHPILNAPSFAGELLADRLVREGIGVAGVAPGPRRSAPRGVRLADAGESLGGGRVTAVITTPIADVLKRCNADSENLYAEALLKRTAHAVTREPGSWTSGAAVMRMLISERLGPAAAAGATISDGSGLSRDNSVSPTTLTRWMNALARDEKVGPVFIESLARPGEGTMRTRFDEYKLRGTVEAKSGFIRGVRCLAGFVTNKDTGRRVAFAVMVNGLEPDQHRAAVRLQNDIVALLDRTIAPSSRTNDSQQVKVGG